MADLTADNIQIIDQKATIVGTADSDSINAINSVLDLTILSGAGNDIIISGNGNDTIDGGEGDDTLFFPFSTSLPSLRLFPHLTIDGITTFSNINGVITMTSSYGTDTITNVENFKFGDSIYTVGQLNSIFSNTNQVISGTFASEFLWGGLGNDTINGLDGDDTIRARDGDDTINSGTGNDVVNGESGNDIINAGIGDDWVYGGDGNDIINGEDGDDSIYGENGIDTINGGAGNDRLYGGDGTDVINGGDGDDWLYSNSGDYAGDGLTGDNSEDHMNGGAGNDYFYGDIGNDYMNGGDGLDIFVLPYLYRNEITNISKLKNGGYLISSAYGNDEIKDVEFVSFQDGTTTPIDLMAEKALPTITFNGQSVDAVVYSGPVEYLEYLFLGERSDDIVFGSLSNDFFNLLDGDDAADGGLGDDVLDGGRGSNFLTGGAGNDTFFLDGREGSITWSTITDFGGGDSVNIWGWVDGISKLLVAEESNGAEGFKGATFHYDLNNDGTIETSITFSGISLSEAPTSSTGSIENNGYLWFA